MNNIDSDEEEVIYDYYEKKRKNFVFLPHLIILIFILFAIGMITYVQDLVQVFDSINSISNQKIYNSSVESGKNNTDVLEFNNKIRRYFSDVISGKDVKKLLSIIEQNNIESEHKVRILFHVSEASTTSNTYFYELSSINANMNTYIAEIKNNVYYFVDVHKSTADGTISSIVISDDFYKHLYKNKFK